MRRRTTQTSTNLPVCKTFSKPVLCSPLIRPGALVPCIIPGFRVEASAVDPAMEHHIVSTSSDTTDIDGAFRSLSVDRDAELSAITNERKTASRVQFTYTTKKKRKEKKLLSEILLRQSGSREHMRSPPAIYSAASLHLSLLSSARLWQIC